MSEQIKAKACGIEVNPQINEASDFQIQEGEPQYSSKGGELSCLIETCPLSNKRESFFLEHTFTLSDQSALKKLIISKFNDSKFKAKTCPLLQSLLSKTT